MEDDINEMVSIRPNKRKVTSIYVDPLIWKAFYKRCRSTGSSSCNVLEAFMYAFVRAVPNQPVSALPVVNVNLTVNRVVQRVHRVEKASVEPRVRRLRVVRADGSFYFVKGYPMNEMEYEKLLKKQKRGS